MSKKTSGSDKNKTYNGSSYHKTRASTSHRNSKSSYSSSKHKSSEANLIKGPFTSEEDAAIIKFVKINGPSNWPHITQYLPCRSAKQCRERWFNHLNPDVSKSFWTPEEDNLIFVNHNKYGSRWSLIAKLIPGRTDNAIKNRWNSSISKRIKKNAEGKLILLEDPTKRRHKKEKTVSADVTPSEPSEPSDPVDPAEPSEQSEPSEPSESSDSKEIDNSDNMPEFDVNSSPVLHIVTLEPKLFDFDEEYAELNPIDSDSNILNRRLSPSFSNDISGSFFSVDLLDFE